MAEPTPVEHVAFHLAAALKRWQDRCREQGVDFPPELAALLSAVSFWARGGQGRPNLDGLLTGVDGAPLMVRYSEAARLLDVSERTVRRLVADGELPVVSVGGCRRIRRADVDRFAAGLAPEEGAAA